MSLRTGVRLGDRYELLDRIAAGGMGEVWRALDATLGRTVAVKVLRSEFTVDATFLARFRVEARNTAMLSHANIAQVYDYGEALADGEHVAYLVMELVAGEPLSAVIGRGTRLPPERVLDIMGQTAAGLGVAHRAGVVHRDVKPANLIVRPDRVVKITDFGISRATDHVPLTGTGMVIGTAQYLSPEQAMGRVVTPASDVYALGVVGYECLVGRRPFDGESSVAVALAHVNDQPTALPGDLPAPVRDLILQAMSKDPGHRFGDGAAFATAIRAVATGQPLPPRAGNPQAIPAGGSAGQTRQLTAGALPPRGGNPPTAVMRPVQPARARPVRPPARYAPPVRRREKSRAGQWSVVVLLLVLLIAVVLVGVWTIQRNDTTQAGAPQAGSQDAVSSESSPAAASEAQDSTIPPSDPSPEPEPVFVDTNAYVGVPLGDVEATLTALGLRVVTEEIEVSADVLEAAGVQDQPFDKNDVITTVPTLIEVPAGSTVTVFFAKKDYEPDNGNGNGSGGDG